MRVNRTTIDDTLGNTFLVYTQCRQQIKHARMHFLASVGNDAHDNLVPALWSLEGMICIKSMIHGTTTLLTQVLDRPLPHKCVIFFMIPCKVLDSNTSSS